MYNYVTHCDTQFAGSSAFPTHVKMIGFIGIGNNSMVGASDAVEQALAK
ncbi:MAG: GGGtGRT protein [Clostridiales bacterium]|nr:GGGtGRT protein [Clostridiales bacterium]